MYTPPRSVKRRRGSNDVTRVTTKYVNTPTNNLAGRAAMKKSGTHVIPKGKKNVKVSKELREKIKEVTKDSAIRGTYNKIIFAPLGIYTKFDAATPANDNCFEATTQQLLASQTVLDGVSTKNMNGNAGCLIGGTYYNSDPATGVLVPLAGADWNFFTGSKFVDAASILFHKKPVRCDASDVTGNLTVKVANGVTQTSNVAGLKLDIIDSSVTWVMKNNSQRAVTVEFYHCSPKKNNTLSTALTTFRNAGNIETLAVGSNYSGNWAQIDSAPGTFVGAELCKQIGVDPNAFDTFTAQYKYEKLIIVLGPGETCQHKIQGPKNYHLDFNKHQMNDMNELIGLQKYSISVFAKIYPDMVDVDRAYDAGSNGNDIGGHFVKGAASNNVLQISDLITCKYQEHYVISLPEAAGFISTVAAGQPQALNLRKPTKCFVTYPNLGPVLKDLTYDTHQEENPATTTSASITN